MLFTSHCSRRVCSSPVSGSTDGLDAPALWCTGRHAESRPLSLAKSRMEFMTVQMVCMRLAESGSRPEGCSAS